MGAARCWTRLGRNAWAVGDPPGSAEALAEAERLLLEDEPSVELARVQCEQARWLMLMSRYEQAEARCRQAIDTARAVGSRLEEGHASNTLGVALCLLGHPDEGLALLRWSLEVAEEVGDPESLNRAYSNLASCLVDWARLEEAAAVTLDMVAAGEHLEGIRLNGSVFNSADALVRLGRWDEAEAMARDYGGVPSGNCASNPLMLHVTLALLQGEFDRARPLLEEVGTRTASLTDVQFRGSFHLLDAQLALVEGRFTDASDAIEQAFGLVAGTEDESLSMEICAIGIRAVVDGAVQARAERRRVDDAKVRLHAAELADKADEIAERPRRQGLPRLPRTLAWLAQCRAEAARTGPPAPQLWQSAADAWESLNEPFGTAYCRWREAEACWPADPVGNERPHSSSMRGARRCRSALSRCGVTSRTWHVGLGSSSRWPTSRRQRWPPPGLTSASPTAKWRCSGGWPPAGPTRRSPRRSSSARRRRASTCRTSCANLACPAASTLGRSGNRPASAEPSGCVHDQRGALSKRTQADADRGGWAWTGSRSSISVRSCASVPRCGGHPPPEAGRPAETADRT